MVEEVRVELTVLASAASEGLPPGLQFLSSSHIVVVGASGQAVVILELMASGWPSR